MTQIVSDSDSDGFIQFEQEEQKQAAQNVNTQKISYSQAQVNPTISMIRVGKQFKKIYTVEITPSEKTVDLKFFENQFYFIRVFKSGEEIHSQPIQRRYSDFDLLYEMLFRNYPGFIFPAFPQKGLVSYAKTKVSVTKDESYMQNRIKMIQRFLSTILNEEKFKPENCPQIRKFFSQKEFQLFKKQAKNQTNNNVISNTINFFKNYLKLNHNARYDSIIDEIKTHKKPFEEYHFKVRDLLDLVKEEITANLKIISDYRNQEQKKISIDTYLPSFHCLVELLQGYNKELQPVVQELQDLNFYGFCENEDFVMILKRIELFEQLRDSESNYKNLAQYEKEFNNYRNELEKAKKQKLQKLEKEYREVFQKLCEIQNEVASY